MKVRMKIILLLGGSGLLGAERVEPQWDSSTKSNLRLVPFKPLLKER